MYLVSYRLHPVLSLLISCFIADCILYSRLYSALSLVSCFLAAYILFSRLSPSSANVTKQINGFWVAAKTVTNPIRPHPRFRLTLDCVN